MAISAIAPPGPYSPIGSVIGLTVLVLILAYDVDPQRTRLQSVAFGGVCALVTVLVIGYVLEYVFATNRPKRFDVLKRELPQNEDLSYSEVPPYVVLVFWFGMTCGYTWLDRCRAREWLGRRVWLQSRDCISIRKVPNIQDSAAPRSSRVSNDSLRLGAYWICIGGVRKRQERINATIRTTTTIS